MNDIGLLVYAGPGSSHSWTWLADLFESKGVFDVRFLESSEFVSHLDGFPAAVIISGGDGFKIAETLSGPGFRKLEQYISSGGLYVGICAGAYLPLHSSMPPFSEFNLSSTRIENLRPSDSSMSGLPLRVAVGYGSCSIVHPIRGDVKVGNDGAELVAPIYGGPVFREPAEDEVLLRYKSFTPATEVQMSLRFAEETVLGKPAAVRSRHGKGEVILLGPHLEHPRYPEANSLFLDLMRTKESQSHPVSGFADHPTLGKAIADLKVAIVGLENRTFVVGKKLWDGSRYLELVRAIESRSWTLDRDLAEEVATSLWRVREAIMAVGVGMESDADDTTMLLVEAARTVVDSHFQSMVRKR